MMMMMMMMMLMILMMMMIDVDDDDVDDCDYDDCDDNDNCDGGHQRQPAPAGAHTGYPPPWYITDAMTPGIHCDRVGFRIYNTRL
jgi:hypothetical protein